MGKSVASILLAPTLLVSIASSAAAHGPQPHQVVAELHAALAAGDGEKALGWLLPEATIYEGGRAETREEYAAHHLAADMAFAQATDREVVEQSKQIVGDVAWVTTRTRTTGSRDGKPIDAEGVETVVLQHVEAGWRIAHVHWSSRARAD